MNLRVVLIHSVVTALAVLLAWFVSTGMGSFMPFINASDRTLGGMWTIAAVVFVYREAVKESVSSAATRVSATAVSFVLMTIYFLLFPFTPIGLAVVIGLGCLILDLLGRPQDAVTASITTVVVMVVADLGPRSADWTQPILRLGETLVGVVIGLLAAWLTRGALTPADTTQ